MKFTFLKFDIQIIFLKFFENHMNVLNVFFENIEINENIVDINDCK